MFSCFLVTRTPATCSLFNAASDWVGSCATITKRRRDRTPKAPAAELCALRQEDRGSRGRRRATRCPKSVPSVNF